MRPFVLTIAFFVILLFLSSCEKESAFCGQEAPVSYLEGDGGDNTTLSFRQGTETTLYLLSTGASIDTGADSYKVYFERDYSFGIQTLSDVQQLNFENGQNQWEALTLPTLSFDENPTVLRITFDGSALDVSGLELQATQAIIVEEIIIN